MYALSQHYLDPRDRSSVKPMKSRIWDGNLSARGASTKARPSMLGMLLAIPADASFHPRRRRHRAAGSRRCDRCLTLQRLEGR